MYGVKARLPVDLTEEEDDADIAPPSNESQEVIDRIVSLTSGDIDATRTTAKANIENAQARQKTRYDIQYKGPSFVISDLVLKYNRRRDTRMGDKLGDRYTGPFEIVEAIGKGVFRLKDVEKLMKQVVNAVNLKMKTSDLSLAGLLRRGRKRQGYAVVL